MTRSKSDEETQQKDKPKKAKTRGQGEGSIYQRKDGRWVSEVQLGYSNGKRDRKFVYGKTRKEVADQLADILNKQKQGLPIVGDKQTVKQLLTDWLENTIKVSTRPSTYVSYKHICEIHLIPEIGHIKLSKLSPQIVQQMIKNLMIKNRYVNKKKEAVKQTGKEPIEKGTTQDAKPLSNRTVQYCLTVLRMALKKAETYGLVSRNVALLVNPPKAEQYEVKPMDADEAHKFLNIIKGDRLEALFRVGLALGLRRGEALALKWSGVDLENATLRVSGSLQRLSGELTIQPPKTKKSARTMKIPKTLLAILREHRTRQLEERLKAECWQDNDLVFCTSIGTPIEPRNVRRKLDSLMKDSGMRYFRLHDIRHFFASLLLAQGVELKMVSELLGHSSIRITGDIYAHVMPAAKDDALDLLDAVLSNAK
jgi:integrase